MPDPLSTPAARSASSAGIWLALLSAASFGSSGTFAKPLLEAGWSPGAAVTARIAGAALVLAVPSALALRGRWGLLRENAWLIISYGLVAMAGCQLFYFNAVTTLSVAVALLLEYLGVVLVVLWLWARLGQRPRPATMVGIALSVLGLLLILDITGGMEVDLRGVLWGLAAAVGLAVYFVLSGKPATVPPLVMAGGGMVVAAVTLALAGIAGLMPMHFATAPVRMAGMDLPWFLPILELCLIAAALPYAVGIAATRRLGSKIASFLGLTEVMFSVLCAWLLLGELPMPVQMVGGVLIVAGVVAVRYDEIRHATAPEGYRGSEPVVALDPLP